MSVDSILSLARKVQQKTAKVCVVGLGYVGLPLAVVFAAAGYRTIGVDADESKIAHLIERRPYIRDGFVETTLPRLLHTGNLTPTVDLESGVQQSDFIILCLPTPLDEERQPDLRVMRDALTRIARVLSAGKFIVIESSVYPGFTEQEAKTTLEKSGLKAGSDFGLAYSPERIDFGNAKYYVTDINKVVGGLDALCTDIAAELYGSVLHAEVTKVSSPSVAEATKMLENLYRYVNISLVNELAVLLEEMGIDVFEVIRAASTKPFGFHPHFPGPGVGGHCIPKDPYYLAFRAEQFGAKLELLSAGARINARMPAHVCRGVRVALGKAKKSVSDSRITVLGLAYKAETSEVRNSPAIEVVEGLSKMGAEVVTYDPYVPEISVGGRTYHSETSVDDALANSDCYAFLVDHKILRKIDWSLIKSNANPPPLVYDARGMFDGLELASRGICYTGLGRPSLFPSSLNAGPPQG